MRRHDWALAIGAGILAVLWLLLGTLQYRWMSQVARTLAFEKRASLHRRGTALSDDVARELTRVFYWFQLEGADGGEERTLDERWRSWRESDRHVGLVTEVWVVARGPDGERAPAEIRRFEPATRTLVAAAWPPGSEEVRRRLADDGPRPLGLLGAGAGGAQGELHLVISGAMGPPPAPGGAARPPPPAATVVVRLDRKYFTDVLFAGLAEQHLAAGADDEAVVAALASSDGDRFFTWPAGRDVVAGDQHDPIAVHALRPDLATSALMAGIRPPPARPPGVARGRPGGGGPGGPGFGGPGPGPGPRPGPGAGPGRRGPPGPPGPPPGWRLSLAYAAGPVDAVVTALHRRNLALGFGLLAVLGGALATLLVSVRRAQALAERQRQFMASVSHELRTPLAVIGSAAENLRDGTVDEAARIREYGELIHGESKRLEAMVDDVLRLAAGRDLKDSLHLEPIDLRDVVDTAVESFQPEVRARGGRIERRDPPAPAPVVAADPEALRQAVENVLGNALKYGGDQPEVTVSIDRVNAPEGPELRIAVEDRGIGIPAGELGQVFDPFFRGHEAIRRQIRGTGLGLALVSRVMKAHGGGVSVESRPGQGSKFVLHLPCPSERG